MTTEAPGGAAVPSMGEDYLATGFGSRIGFGERPCVVVVDMVRAYVTEGEPFWAPAYAAVLEANRHLLDVARSQASCSSTVAKACGGRVSTSAPS